MGVGNMKEDLLEENCCVNCTFIEDEGEPYFLYCGLYKYKIHKELASEQRVCE